MQSSFLITLRALVMLVSLVVVPLWALIGTEWPAKIASFLGGHARSAADVRAESAPSHIGLTEAPAFRGEGSAGTASAPPGMNPQIPQAPAEPREVSILPPQPIRQPGSAAVPPSGDDRMPRDPRVGSANVPASYEEPAPAANPNRRAVVLGPSTDPRDQFKSLERRLRELGATYYRLETWGDNGELYRFYCQMAQADLPESNRLFEATDRDAFQAIARVVHDVEGWRSGRLR